MGTWPSTHSIILHYQSVNVGECCVHGYEKQETHCFVLSENINSIRGCTQSSFRASAPISRNQSSS